MALMAAAAAATTPAQGAIHAVYGGPLGAVEIWLSDNGDFVGWNSEHQRVIGRGGEAFLVEDRLTGPIVLRVADLAAIVRARRTAKPAATAAGSGPQLERRGTRTVSGREGDAYFYPGQTREGDPKPAVVISRDPALAPLGRALTQLFEAENLQMEVDNPFPSGFLDGEDPVKRLLATAAPLQYGNLSLETVDAAAPPADFVAFPATPESAAELSARLDREAREAKEEDEHPSDRTMIKRAVFAEGRLWLLTDKGGLSSVADGGDSLRPEDAHGQVADICSERGRLLALIDTKSGRSWTLRRHDAAGWEPVASSASEAARFVALDCSAGAPLVISDKALTDVSDPGRPRTVMLSGLADAQGRVAAIHVEPDAVYLGLNAGEWGGGLRRIDRRTGRGETIERTPAGRNCDGPLSTVCDPVNGIAPMPWKPGCVAVAVGLIHMMSHGRIASVCGQDVEQIYGVSHRPPLDNAHSAEAETGDLRSVAFFGLAAAGGGLLAVGDNGLYRLGPDGKAEYRDWPRFKNIGGVLVSFALPDVILVITDVNARVSVGGAAPMLVVR
jgi:hypothetical protein